MPISYAASATQYRGSRKAGSSAKTAGGSIAVNNGNVQSGAISPEEVDDRNSRRTDAGRVVGHH